MKKNIVKKSVALACAFVLSMGVVGCSNTGSGNSAEVNVPYEVWTTYNTKKVLRDVELTGDCVKMEKGIHVKMAKGEGEMGSLYITTGTDGIDKFDLIPQPLTNEDGDEFSIEQMEVMAQRYIEISLKSRGNYLEEFPLGSYAPDAIVGMDLYKKAKENKIAPNSNQGITVDFKTTADTPAGVYTGTFQLVLDQEIIDIPVSVTVWDYTIPEDTTTASCMLIYENQIVQGEMTSVEEEVDDWYRVYYEQALEYKMNGYMVPESTKSPEKFVENVLRYYDHPNFNTYGLPHQTFLPVNPVYSNGYAEGAGIFVKEDGTRDTDKVARYYGCMDYWFDCLYLLGLEAAKTGKNYFEECYIYPIDEPNDQAALKIAIEWMKDLRTMKNAVADKLVSIGKFSADDPIVESIRDVDIVCTALGDEPALAEFDICYVPQLHELEDYSIQTNIEEHANANGNRLWYYTQIDPAAPAPTSHIDDFLVSGRIMKWVQKYYNVEGWLYWMYNACMQIEGWGSAYAAVDPYEEISRNMGSAVGAMGDGYFVYPASKYGADAPIKSLRLLAHRDGVEDMEALNYLDSLYREYETYYGLPAGTLNVNNVFKGVYDKIFCRSTAFSEDAIFDECREALKDAILRATKEDNKFIYDIQYVGKQATYTFYTSPDYQVKVGGKVLEGVACGDGYKYTYELDASTSSLLESVELVKSSKAETIVLYEKTSTKAVDMTASGFGVSVSTGSEYTAKDTGYAFTMRSNEQDDYFIPQIKFTSVPETFQVIELDLHNTTDEAVKMTLKVTSADGISVSKQIGLTANTTRTVEVLNELSSGKKVASISITFENKREVNGEFIMIGDRTVEIMGMRVR